MTEHEEKYKIPEMDAMVGQYSDEFVLEALPSSSHVGYPNFSDDKPSSGSVPSVHPRKPRRDHFSILQKAANCKFPIVYLFLCHFFI